MARIFGPEGSVKPAIGLETAERRQRRFAALLVIAVSGLLLMLGAFEPLENRMTALRAQMLDRAPTGNVAIVEIDARSLAELSTWPWSRQYHAEAIERLHSAGAEIIAFDVDFSASSEPSGDQAFAKALADAAPVILPIFQQSASDQSGRNAIVRSKPAAAFEAAWVGGVNIFPGSDGVVREYPAATIIDGEIRPSIAALLADSDDLGDRTFQPDWAIDAARIPRVSFVDLVKGRIPRQSIAGKRIVIGGTAIELGDRYTVPRYGSVPGVIVQALATESLLQGRTLSRSGAIASMIGILLIGGVLGAGRFKRFNRSFPPTVVAVILLLAIGPVIVQARWPVSLDSIPLLFSVLGCATMRILIEIRRRISLNAMIDGETGLANRLALEARLSELADSSPILATAAIEGFDNIRDVIGTDAVSDLVRQASARIEQRIGGPVYRITPDILAWLQPGPDEDDVSNGTLVLEITELFREPVETYQGKVDVRLTIGLDRDPVASAIVPKIERALAAISTARTAGDTCHWYKGADPAERRQLSLMGDLRRGMAVGEVTIAYQPKLDLKSGQISHAEALVRWHHPIDGLIPPDRFIPLAESTGVVSELTDFVMRAVVADSARLNAAGRQLCIAVNVSAADIASLTFVDRVKRILDENGGRPSNLALEVTENAIIRTPATAISVLTALREHGIRLSIDDYGTGQSTLSYLKQLPVHELKIDKSFVSSICASSSDEIMVRSTIDMAHDLGLQVVAEGVEDAATFQLLSAMGCDFIQGYLVGRPMPFDALCAMTIDPAALLKVA